jgi:cell wall-associated NlpC family hydrolase
VHAPSSGGTVRLDSLSNSYWRSSYLNARRVLDSGQLARNP